MMNFRNKKIFFLVLVIFLATFFFVGDVVHAQNPHDDGGDITYTLLEDLGFGQQTYDAGNFGAYFSDAFNLGVGLAGVLAVLMLVVGGIEYISAAANPSAKESAKKRIWAAIGGLLLVLVAVIVLATINPQLTPGFGGGSGGGGGTGSGGSGGGGGGGGSAGDPCPGCANITPDPSPDGQYCYALVNPNTNTGQEDCFSTAGECTDTLNQADLTDFIIAGDCSGPLSSQEPTSETPPPSDSATTYFSGAYGEELTCGGTGGECEIPLGVPIKVGAACEWSEPCVVDSDLSFNLQALNQDLSAEGIDWQVTEAWPPTVVHQNVCHQDGTCVDANFTTSDASADNINTFISASSDSNLTAVYEVQTEDRKQELIDAGVSADSIQVVSGINAEHFSVYSN